MEFELQDDIQILAKIGSWHWDVNNSKVTWSKNMFRILGYEPFELNPTYELAYKHVHNSDKKRYEETLTSATTSKTEYYFENRIIRNDNSVIPVISRGKCILDENQNLVHMIGTVQDISLLKELEIINQDKNRAEENDRMKSTIIGVIGHDLRGPLVHIKMFSEKLIEIIEHEKKSFEYAGIILNSSKKTIEILDNLIKWAIADINIKTFNPIPIAPHHIVENIIKFLEIQFTQKNITILNLIKTHEVVIADKAFITVIIRNVLYNSLKYSKLNGEIKIALSTELNKTLFTISDNGIGMNSEIIKNIFSEKISNSRNGTNNEIGHGYGLQVCKTLIEKHNGNIRFESKSGVGTTCFISL